MSARPISTGASGAALVNRIMTVMEAAFDPAYGEAWNRRQVTDALILPTTHALIVDASGEPIPDTAPSDDPRHPVGFVLTRHAADEEELLLIAVDPAYRRRGIARSLIGQLYHEAKSRGATQIFLEMRRGNPAIHLYRKAGFEPVGERRQYYRMANGERVDAITFRSVI